uniref:NADP-dependent oxidoreductase domain-containing protein n=1 Tax=Prymnesium polylepis TaxID=72548 RepID=A0A6V4EK69_9EUKA|mmetsp:Transcript_26393/g.65432  ORF Transcript_26393/g.65432 Transcript_26393/m.65432 type:complete len:279 (+) Transcript_26393:415-1251(+)
MAPLVGSELAPALPSASRYLGRPPEYLRAPSASVSSVRVLLNDGAEMPAVAYGTYRANGLSLRAGVLQALRSGYRHIDTASAYANEAVVAEAIRDSGVPRSERFIATKLWSSDHGANATRAAVWRSLAALGTGYIDLYLIHAPRNNGRTAAEAERLRRESWEVMSELRGQGVLRSIGVSNFAPRHLAQLKSWGGTLPAVEFHPHLLQLGLLEACQADGIQLDGCRGRARRRGRLGRRREARAHAGAGDAAPRAAAWSSCRREEHHDVQGGLQRDPLRL